MWQQNRNPKVAKAVNKQVKTKKTQGTLVKTPDGGQMRNTGDAAKSAKSEKTLFPLRN